MPFNWNTHYNVLKDRTTTSIRLESNSSFPNGSTALTDLQVKGSNTLDSLFTNLIRFRDYKVTLVDNISKACNGIKLEEIECHTRRKWFKFYLNESQNFFKNAYIGWMCFKNKFKVIKDNISNNCAENTEINYKGHIFKVSVVSSKYRVALPNELTTARSEHSSHRLLTKL